MNNVTFLDHTADTGFIITADSLEALFITSAKAMFNIICPRKLNYEHVQHTISITAPDMEQLLVNWLSELNFLFQTEQFLLSDISELTIKDLSLTTRFSGEKVNFHKHDILMEIKAVTYHKLYIKKINNKWQTQIIFDI